MRLASADPSTFPLIDPNYFSSPFDRFAMVEAVKAARRFLNAPAWKDLVVGRFGTIGAAETDEEIVEAARNAVVTIWHPVSSAWMSPIGASWGVLDPDLCVKGAEGLRVVDASAFVSSLPVEILVLACLTKLCSRSSPQVILLRSFMSLLSALLT